MILDTIDHLEQYRDWLPDVYRALQAMQTYTKDHYPGGRVELDGSDLFLLPCAYETHAPENASFEAHQQYLDVMYMVAGSEIIYVKPTRQLKRITKEYDPASDALLADYEPDATLVRLDAGSFVVLFPQDAHAPACCAGQVRPVKKVIGKVRIAR
ncbi:MAG: YhcH/YjgK/YiaL family protein [Oscillospiraceae bacterium]|nr:YhcH/YjgK/YiaL family protein [Oscillospiraceae bacterium]